MASQFMEVEATIPANATTENIFAGQRFERLPFDSLVDLALTGSAAGLQYEMNIGGRSISARVPTGTANRSPLIPDDIKVANAEGFLGELVQVTGVNTTAGALVIFARVVMEEAEMMG